VALSGDIINSQLSHNVTAVDPRVRPIMTIQNRRNKPKKLVDLESDDCRWPLGDPRQPHFHFCGAQQRPGYPYCERHCQVAFHNPGKLRIQPPPTRMLTALVCTQLY